MEIYDKIKNIRLLREMPIKALAIEICYSESILRKIEAGSRKLSDDILKGIKTALNIVGVPLTDEEIRLFKEELCE